MLEGYRRQLRNVRNGWKADIGFDSNQIMTRPATAALGALFGPLIITAIYLFLSRWPERWFTAGSDQLALGLAILAGLVALCPSH